MYKHLVTLAGAQAVFIDTYPDFRLTAARIERTSPAHQALAIQLAVQPYWCSLDRPGLPGDCRVDGAPTAYCCSPMKSTTRSGTAPGMGPRNASDRSAGNGPKPRKTPATPRRCPSPAAYSENLLLRGFSKTWAMTGWRLGYAAGPSRSSIR